MSKKIVAVVGPTASGKTALAFSIAESFPSEIVIMDAFQIYKGLDIGTAKPSDLERAKVRHHLIDIVEPDLPYSVSEYSKDARLAIDGILERRNLPILVGGTGLYLNALSKPYKFGGAPANEEIRQGLEKYLEINGKEALFALLEEKDPISAQRLHINDTRRVIRALEVIEQTGLSISKQKSDEKGEYEILPFAISWDRQLLYERINKRVDDMINLGLVCEVEKLYKMGLDETKQSMQGIGYKEIVQYLKGVTDLKRAVELIKQHTRNYAKRQLTWFRRDERIVWTDADNIKNSVKEHITKFLGE